MSPQKEVTGKRPTNYSQWHRAHLPKWCYLTDGDWFEQRMLSGVLKSVAYIEAMEVPPLFIHNAQSNYPLWPSKKALMKEMYQRMDIPCFVVRHTPDCKAFCLSRITASGDETEAIVMSEGQYKNWLLQL